MYSSSIFAVSSILLTLLLFQIHRDDASEVVKREVSSDLGSSSEENRNSMMPLSKRAIDFSKAIQGPRGFGKRKPGAGAGHHRQRQFLSDLVAAQSQARGFGRR